jgi:hypothetical protein
MKHIICHDLAPAAVDFLLRTLYGDEAEFEVFMESVLSDVNEKDFGVSSSTDTASICSCEAITIVVQCRAVDLSVREEYLRDVRPQDNFEEEDFASWDGVLLALQFASTEVLVKISKRIPVELLACAIQILPPEVQSKAKQIFYQ